DAQRSDGSALTQEVATTAETGSRPMRPVGCAFAGLLQRRLTPSDCDNLNWSCESLQLHSLRLALCEPRFPRRHHARKYFISAGEGSDSRRLVRSEEHTSELQ